MNLGIPDFEKEIEFIFSRSSGKGGQHVNKTESRVSLFFNVNNSKVLTEEEKSLIKGSKLVQLTADGLLQIDVEDSRSQFKNKKIAKERFIETLEKGLIKPKKRKPTKPTKAAVQKRLNQKEAQAEKKKNRQWNY